MASDPHRPFIAGPGNSAARTRQPTTAELVQANRGPGFGAVVVRTLLGFAALLLVLFVLFLAATAIEGDGPIAPAPWAERSAPSVAPGPLDVQ
ncbi:MAG: hypothetical protein H0V81_16065 [Solirubrobacterales bacterium]|nr:hypothetical protein [Solirubrobacterales bacterium]